MQIEWTLAFKVRYTTWEGSKHEGNWCWNRNIKPTLKLPWQKSLYTLNGTCNPFCISYHTSDGTWNDRQLQGARWAATCHWGRFFFPMPWDKQNLMQEGTNSLPISEDNLKQYKDKLSMYISVQQTKFDTTNSFILPLKSVVTAIPQRHKLFQPPPPPCKFQNISRILNTRLHSKPIQPEAAGPTQPPGHWMESQRLSIMQAPCSPGRPWLLMLSPCCIIGHHTDCMFEIGISLCNTNYNRNT